MDGCRMNPKCLTPDRISNLPLSIIQTILTLMPIRDAFRTSILSRKWRYYCINIPKLEFVDKMLQRSSKIFHVVYHVLLLHIDPVLEFSVRFSKPKSCYEIDRIILYLSRDTTLEKFTLHLAWGTGYKLPSSFFSLKKLTHLKLQNCAIQSLPASFEFSILKSLWFDNVNITMDTLLRFLCFCPLLTSFTLMNYYGNGYFNFVEILRCLPTIENLHIDFHFVELFPSDITLERPLPNMLVHLKVVNLDGLFFTREDELRSVLLLVTSSPNIEKIYLQMFLNPKEAISQTATNFFDLHDYSYVILDNLRELEITNFNNKGPEMDFVKFILTKSPTLKAVRIVIDNKIPVSDELKMLRDLLWIPRASNGAQIKLERP